MVADSRRVRLDKRRLRVSLHPGATAAARLQVRSSQVAQEQRTTRWEGTLVGNASVAAHPDAPRTSDGEHRSSCEWGDEGEEGSEEGVAACATPVLLHVLLTTLPCVLRSEPA